MANKVFQTSFMGANIQCSYWESQTAGKSIAHVGQKSIAKILRKILKNKYPDIKFSVTCDTGAWVNSITIKYPKTLNLGRAFGNEVYEKCKLERFKSGHFNGMVDSYEYEKKTPLQSDDQKHYLDANVRYISVTENWK